METILENIGLLEKGVPVTVEMLDEYRVIWAKQDAERAEKAIEKAFSRSPDQEFVVTGVNPTVLKRIR